MPLFTVQEILEVTSARVDPEHDLGRVRGAIRRICTDSRDARQGDLFVALVGERFDGHDFVDMAFARGSVGVLIQDRSRLGKLFSSAPKKTSTKRARAPLVLEVPDTLLAYQQLAAHHRARFQYPVVAVTGSNGKTTTKEMLARVLGQRWPILKTEGNLNNRIGVPQTLLRLTPRYRVAVVEMGVDHRGQTTRLCEIVRPTIGLITNIGPDHLEFFGSLDGSAQAKAELVDWMPATGMVVLNADDPYFEELASRARCQVISFGRSRRADVRAVETTLDSRRGATFRLALHGRTRQPMVTLKAHGVHNVSNALAAAAVGHYFGLGGPAITKGLAAFRPASMRSQVLARDGVRIIHDCYNANPASMKAAIDMLVEIGTHQRTIAVLGDMLELGAEALLLHREVGTYLASRGISYLIATGPLGKNIAEGAREGGMPQTRILEAADSSQAAAAAKELIRGGDVVLVKASRGMRMELVTNALDEALDGGPMGAEGNSSR